MLFKITSSPKDEKLFYNHKNRGEQNVFTLGRGTYGGGDLSVEFGNGYMNVLGGRFCSLAKGINFLINGNHPMRSVSTSPLDVVSVVKNIFGEVRSNLRQLPGVRKNPHQVIIGNDVWIGRYVTILGGVKIGNGAVIGANAVVAKDIPPYAIAVGNPARVIKYRFDEETIKKMLAVKWWNWSLEKIADNFPLMNDVEKFLETHYSPELEEFPEDEFTQKLNNFTGGGIGKVYQFISDFRAQNPLWLKVVKDFKQANLEDALLVIWLDKDTTDEDTKTLAEAVGDDKNILTLKHEKTFSPAALRKSTHFITTREMTTLEAMDYLWDTDVKVISALDNGIFST